MIVGHASNTATSGVVGGTIGGGGYYDGSVHLPNEVSDNYGTGGGRDNQAGSSDDDPGTDRFATVGGGVGNRASGRVSTVGGGTDNEASLNWSVVAGGGRDALVRDGGHISLQRAHPRLQLLVLGRRRRDAFVLCGQFLPELLGLTFEASRRSRWPAMAVSNASPDPTTRRTHRGEVPRGCLTPRPRTGRGLHAIISQPRSGYTGG